MTGNKSPLERLGRMDFYGCHSKTPGTQSPVRDRFVCRICALSVLLRQKAPSWRRRAESFALVTFLISQSLLAQTPRLEVIQAMLQRPNDPWPRGKGHVVLAVPGDRKSTRLNSSHL